jgi:hypothetical protein
MRTRLHYFKALLLIGPILFSACALRHPVETRRLQPVDEAWQAARARLHKMCPRVPRTEDELTDALSMDQDNGCYARFAKDSPLPMLEDWHWHWLPPYRIVAAIHDEELRKRETPKLYEEYLSALNRFLANKADRGEITPAQIRYASMAGWNWMSGKMQKQHILLDKNSPLPERADSVRERMLTDVAAELATVATVALAISAPDKTYQAKPTNCYAHVIEESSYTIECY